MADHAKIIRRAMQYAQGTSLERIEAAFHGLTGPELDQMYGMSGRTKGQTLETYRTDRREWQQANEYLETLLANDGR